MRSLFRVLWSLGAAFVAGTAAAQPYPAGKVIRIVSGYEAGGGATIGLRMFAEEIGKPLGTNVIIESRPGASFAVAARAVRVAPPDGFTLFAGGLGSDPLLNKHGVRVLGELKPITMVTEIPLVFVTNSAKPLRSVAEVVAYAKQNPGALMFASVGGNAYLNLMMSVFASRAGGFTYTHVPYKGAPQIQLAITSGEVDIALAAVKTASSNLASGRVTPILIGSMRRSPLLPNTPSLEEVGLQSIAVDSKVGLWAPPGTPPEIVAVLSNAAQATLKNQAYVARFTDVLGAAPMGTTPEFMERRFEQEFGLMQEGIRLSKYEPN